METNLIQRENEGQNTNVFRELLEIQILLKKPQRSLKPYDQEVQKILQSSDELFDRMLEV